jgi:hypothetical protein
LLVIDDNPSSLELLSNALAQPGLESLRVQILKKDYVYIPAADQRSS